MFNHVSHSSLNSFFLDHIVLYVNSDSAAAAAAPSPAPIEDMKEGKSDDGTKIVKSNPKSRFVLFSVCMCMQSISFSSFLSSYAHINNHWFMLACMLLHTVYHS